MTEHVALWGRDIDDDSSPARDGVTDDGHHAPSTEPIPVVESGNTESGGHTGAATYDDYDTYESQETVRSFSYADSVAQSVTDRRVASPGQPLTFKFRPTPWYRTRRGLIVLIAVLAALVLLTIIPLLLRSPGSDEPTDVTPSEQPAPSSAQPTLTSSAPAPPPPPAPSAQEVPVYQPRYQPPGGGSGSRSPKPEIGVTRAPMSVSPKPVTPPTSAEVGKHGSTSRW